LNAIDKVFHILDQSTNENPQCSTSMTIRALGQVSSSNRDVA
jgi:hypothetical protein